MDFTTTIDVDSLRALVGKPSVVILDCRFDLAAPAAGRQAYLRGHILTARYLDLNADLSSPASPTSGRHPLPEPVHFGICLGRLGIRSDTQVIAYDEANGSIAARAWWLLKWVGHRPVAVLDGGMKAWVAGGGALESGGTGPANAGAGDTGSPPFGPRANLDSVLSSAEVIEALKGPGRLLVDARAPERFSGAVEPIDPVAGHVPGAVNHPFSANLSADGRFLPADELRRRWLERLAGTEPANVIAMCGSGVTACHNLLAMELAGLPGAKLYAGSWSEWIRDPKRPVARSVEPALGSR